MPGLASTLPVAFQRAIRRIAVEAPMSSTSAAARALSPDWTIDTARAQVLRIPLRHCKSPVAISTTESDLHAKGNPFSNRSDSHQTKTALATFFLQSVTQGEQKAGHHEHAVYPCLPGKLSIG